MRHLVYLFLLKFIGTPCDSFGIRNERIEEEINSPTAQASNPRSVNVALETVLEFDGNNDIAFIDTVQNFLNKLKTTITRNRARDFGDNEDNKPKNVTRDDKKKFVFTNFLAETVTVLKSFNDNDLKAFIDTLGEEVNAWQTRKDIHITDQVGFRRIVYRNLQSLKDLPAHDIRGKLNTLTNRLKFSSGNHGLVAEFLNYLYKKESADNLSNFLNKLKLYRKRSRRKNYTDLKTIIRQGILAIIDPLLNLNTKAIKNISRFYNKYLATDSVDDKESNANKKQSKQGKNRHNRNKIFHGDDILDYIDDHVKIIDKRLSTLGIKDKIKYIIPKEVTSHKHVTIRPATEVTTGKIEENILRPRDKKKKVHFDNTDVSIGREPVLINLNDDSELQSIEEYLSTPNRYKGYKKSTKRKLTPKKDYLRLKTTEKFRKAFRTTAVSAEGLSIEHFGSLFGRDFHRKVNDRDDFVQTELQLMSTVPNKAFTKNITVISKEITKNRSISKDIEYRVEKYDELKNISEKDEDNSKSTEIIEEIPREKTNSIKIQGDIIIEAKATTVKTIEMSTPKPVTTTKRIYNVSIVTKFFNIETMKPKIYLRGHDTSNETDSEPHTTSTLAIANKTDNVNKKLTNDGLENEIEGIMDRYNSTPAAIEFKNLIDEAEMNSESDKKVRDQMKSDLERLMAPPTTKTTATVLFTDPFDDIDQGADIL